MCRMALPRTEEEGFLYTKRAAEAGKVWATYLMGQRAESGRGTRKDLRVAYKWFKKAADKGHPMGMTSRGVPNPLRYW